MENHHKHSLGHRALTLFLFRRIKFSLFLFALTWGVWYGQRWIPDMYRDWTAYAATFLLYISIAYFLVIFLRTYLEYRYYTYTFTEEAFIMTQGYFVRDEIAAVYHQIQNVNIRRAPLDRLIGVSQLVIIMTGLDRDGRRAQIVLPAVGMTKARLVQKEILIRARRHFASVAPATPAETPEADNP